MHACTQPRRRTRAQATALQVDVYVEAAVYDELAEHSQTDLVKVLKTRRVLLSTLEIRRFWVFNADRAMVLASYLWDLRHIPWQLLSLRPVRR